MTPSDDPGKDPGDDPLAGLTIVDHVPGAGPVARDDRVWLAEGDGWRLWRDGGVWMMQYQSGEQGGGLRSIAIDDACATGLRNGSDTLDQVLIRHHAS